MRTITQTLREALHSEETGEVIVMLLFITHPELPGPIRLSSHPSTRISEQPLQYVTNSRGLAYDFAPMTVLLPDEVTGTPPQSRLIIENVDGEMINILRSTSRPAKVKMELVKNSDPDLVEITVPVLDLRSVEYDAASISITLTIDALVTEPFPSGSFTPGYFPGLF